MEGRTFLLPFLRVRLEARHKAIASRFQALERHQMTVDDLIRFVDEKNNASLTAAFINDRRRTGDARSLTSVLDALPAELREPRWLVAEAR